MKQNLPSYTVLVLVACTSFSAAAEEKKEPPWSGNVQFGFSATGGNTTSSSTNGGVTLQYKEDKWNNKVNFNAINNTSEGETSAELYDLEVGVNYYQTKKDFVSYTSSNTYNEFSTYDITIVNAIGLGKQLIGNKKVTLDVQLGPGYRFQRVAETGEKSEELVGQMSSDFVWNISKVASFEQTFNVNTGSDNTQLKAKSALTTKILDNLGLQLGYTITHNTNLPEGSKNTKKTDYYSSVNVIYSF
ncbi:DUF481 domain-containing protein [Vibrio sp. S4M6]|uniref:DUF481 domain-containing protein n=1 Tax=Vibrio sinus TaxID=2946865 RepID=UPI002029D670|nr:DUF481 domain-containing protein [Vibrio sinus]MCL9782464.1 DUF481 domain-containing protein [Vibrio sinus]